jgi:hypothetical protein
MLYQLCNYNIIIIEQSKDNQFNIGKLKNIGFDYLNNKIKKRFDNYIFTDIDMIPDSNLIDYFFKISDSLNALAIRGTRYENKKEILPFAGGIISCTKSVFEELNGYPNNFYGWQGEDNNLLLRLYDINKPLYYNKFGSVMDIEEIQGSTKSIDIKLKELKGQRESSVWEKNINYKNYKTNGLTNLNYKILDEINYKNNYHIIVDLLYDESIKKYPQDFIFPKIGEKEDHDRVKKYIQNIKMIEF